jgi:transposase
LVRVGKASEALPDLIGQRLCREGSKRCEDTRGRCIPASLERTHHSRAHLGRYVGLLKGDEEVAATRSSCAGSLSDDASSSISRNCGTIRRCRISDRASVAVEGIPEAWVPRRREAASVRPCSSHAPGPQVRYITVVACAMARTGRPKPELTLTPHEREQLVRWERRTTASPALALRARIVLACAEGRSNQDVAALCGVSQPTVGKWRRRFCERRLDGLCDEPRSGRPRTVTVEQVEQVVLDTLQSTPENATRWSTRTMAERSGLSRSTIARIWAACGLQPHHAQPPKRPTDPPIAKVTEGARHRRSAEQIVKSIDL